MSKNRKKKTWLNFKIKIYHKLEGESVGLSLVEFDGVLVGPSVGESNKKKSQDSFYSK